MDSTFDKVDRAWPGLAWPQNQSNLTEIPILKVLQQICLCIVVWSIGAWTFMAWSTRGNLNFHYKLSLYINCKWSICNFHKLDKHSMNDTILNNVHVNVMEKHVDQILGWCKGPSSFRLLVDDNFFIDAMYYAGPPKSKKFSATILCNFIKSFIYNLAVVGTWSSKRTSAP